jgi:hypothetical protein
MLPLWYHGGTVAKKPNYGILGSDSREEIDKGNDKNGGVSRFLDIDVHSNEYERLSNTPGSSLVGRSAGRAEQVAKKHS